MDPIFASHLNRIKSSLSNEFNLTTIPEWIEKNTKIRGENFSFKDHEYQLAVLRDQAQEVNIRKCSQIGLTELTVRYTLAVSRIIDGFSTIYTLPTADMATKFSKTRIDPVIESSEDLAFAVDANTDNTEMKRLGDSFIYFKGTFGAKAAISTPADLLVHDEFDFSDLSVLTTYQSRLTHSSHKLQRNFSTPTLPGFGISEKFANSKRKWQMVKCDHCAHSFLPNYFEHVKIPNFDNDLRSINANNLKSIDYKQAKLLCPHCGKEPNLFPEYRTWVVENPDDNYDASGWQIQPFDAPAIITMPDLIVASTRYKRYEDFINFNLGLPAESRENSLARDELLALHLDGIPAFTTHVMGVDMGMTCHVVIAGVNFDGSMHVVHREKVPLYTLTARRLELAAKYRLSMSVFDAYPYTETILRMQNEDPNLYASVYTTSKSTELYKVKSIAEDSEKGKLPLRQVDVNRNKAFDDLMMTLREQKIFFAKDAHTDEFIAHCLDMKRIQSFTQDQEMQFVWKKSEKGNDHFFHALLYCHVAAKLRGASQGLLQMPFIVRSFTVKQPT